MHVAGIDPGRVHSGSGRQRLTDILIGAVQSLGVMPGLLLYMGLYPKEAMRWRVEAVTERYRIPNLELRPFQGLEKAVTQHERGSVIELRSRKGLVEAVTQQ